MNLGFTELLVILGIGLLLFGNRLPNLGRSLGETVRGFKKGLNDEEPKNSVHEEPPYKEKSPQQHIQKNSSSSQIVDVKVEEK